MSERPILFSAPMVRALIDGAKTQTRRIVKHEHVNGDCPCADVFAFNEKRGEWELGECHEGPTAHVGWLKCPYGRAGDQLWVRETWRLNWASGEGSEVEYRADGAKRAWPVNAKGSKFLDGGVKWKPSIFLERQYSRLTLEVTAVRVERLQDISDADAKAEGVDPWTTIVPEQIVPGPGFNRARYGDQPHRLPYAALWDSINGEGAWDLNPWVWVINFEVAA